MCWQEFPLHRCLAVVITADRALLEGKTRGTTCAADAEDKQRRCGFLVEGFQLQSSYYNLTINDGTGGQTASFRYIN